MLRQPTRQEGFQEVVDMAVPDYSVPNWVQHPGEDFARNGAGLRDALMRKQQEDVSNKRQDAELALRQQQIQIQGQLMAQKLAAQQKFQQGVTDIQTKYPQGGPEAARAIALLSMTTGVGGGGASGAADLRAITGPTPPAKPVQIGQIPLGQNPNMPPAPPTKPGIMNVPGTISAPGWYDQKTGAPHIITPPRPPAVAHKFTPEVRDGVKGQIDTATGQWKPYGGKGTTKINPWDAKEIKGLEDELKNARNTLLQAQKANNPDLENIDKLSHSVLAAKERVDKYISSHRGGEGEQQPPEAEIKKRIRVKDKKTGQTGTLPESEMDDSKYEVIK